MNSSLAPVVARRLPVWLTAAGTAEAPASGDAWWIALHVQPGAKRNEVVGEHGGRLKVRLASPPIEGRANAALLRFMAERLALPAGAVRLLSGEQSRQKRIRVVGCSLQALLNQLLGVPE